MTIWEMVIGGLLASVLVMVSVVLVIWAVVFLVSSPIICWRLYKSYRTDGEICFWKTFKETIF